MIDKFGQIMIYVNDPRKCADFWIEKIGFSEVHVEKNNGDILSVEIKLNDVSDINIVLFNRSIVAKMDPELELTTPSILFSSYDIEEMRNKLIASNIVVGDIVEMQGMMTFNFADPENNYFAVRKISN